MSDQALPSCPCVRSNQQTPQWPFSTQSRTINILLSPVRAQSKRPDRAVKTKTKRKRRTTSMCSYGLTTCANPTCDNPIPSSPTSLRHCGDFSARWGCPHHGIPALRRVPGSQLCGACGSPCSCSCLSPSASVSTPEPEERGNLSWDFRLLALGERAGMVGVVE